MTVWWSAIDLDHASYDDLKRRRVVAQGWRALGDLSGAVAHLPSDPGKFIHAVQQLGDVAYLGEPFWQRDREPSRAPQGLLNLLSVKPGDLVVALEGTHVRGVCEVTSPGWRSYGFDGSTEYAQTVGPVEWSDWDDARLGPAPTPPARSVLGLRKLQDAREAVKQAWASIRPPAALAASQRPRCVFVRVGWMEFYGLADEETGPIGGGSHNDDREGAEFANFRIRPDGKVRGYAQPAFGARGLNLSRIDPAGGDEHVNDVLVVMAARRPGGDDLVVVGWYANARAFASIQGAEQDSYLFEASVEDAVLLPGGDREWRVPSGAGGIGQSNVAYALEEGGGPKTGAWIDEVTGRIRSFAGRNLLASVLEADGRAPADGVDTLAGGQGYLLSTAERLAVERHAMDLAHRHYSKDWDVRTLGKPYDLHCSRPEEELRVEVKGTTTGGETILLTHNEVEHAKANVGRVALFVVSEITLTRDETGRVLAGGGRITVHEPWILERHHLQPRTYECRVTPRDGTAAIPMSPQPT